jgi:hypothetical protein
MAIEVLSVRFEMRFIEGYVKSLEIVSVAGVIVVYPTSMPACL